MSDRKHVYRSSNPLTRPDWPSKHDAKPMARNLLPYILRPADHADRILRDTADAVLIKDSYPKAQVHLLVLPKWQPHRDLHPHDAFEDPDFLAMVRAEAAAGLQIAMKILKWKMHRALRKSGMCPKEASALLDRRAFEKDFQIGIHAHPSQHELHVHIISRDMVSWFRYRPHHYQTFNTPFLVPLAAYPLSQDDRRRESQYQVDNMYKPDFDCWRCGKTFGTDWALMLQHLNEEWTNWTRENSSDLNISTDRMDWTPSSPRFSHLTHS